MFYLIRFGDFFFFFEYMLILIPKKLGKCQEKTGKDFVKQMIA